MEKERYTWMLLFHERLKKVTKPFTPSRLRDLIPPLHRRKSESGELESPSPTSAPPVSGHQPLQPFIIKPSIPSILRRRTQTTHKLISILPIQYSSDLLILILPILMLFE
ncbi:hypothetical protein LXL04_007101 [Taraxacum kok-saghyz]